MSKAAELAALIGSQTALSNRNLIINGAMNVAQRGTSVSSVTSDGYKTCDRWNVFGSSFGTYTVSQSSTSPDGFANSLKLDCTAADGSPAAGDHLGVQIKFEGRDVQQLQKGTSTAKSVTVSFFVRSNKTGTYTLELDDRDNTRSFSKTYTISSADTWEYKTVTFAGDTTGALDDDNAWSLGLNWWLMAGSTFTSGTFTTGWEARTNANRVSSSNVNLSDSTSNEWYMTGVQLEVGEQATPFEHRSFGDELARCQRYFLNYADVRNNYGMTGDLGTGSMYNASILMCCIRFPVEMRTAPTMTHGSGTSFYQFWANTAADQFDGWTYWFDANRLGGALQAESNISGTAGHAGRVVVNNSAGDAGYIHLDAEL